MNAETFEKAGEIAVAGKPFNIVAVGGTGLVHGNEDGHGHDHGHAHRNKY